MQYRGDTKGWREPGIVEATTGKELEGMCLDILKEMSQLLGFTFNVSLVPDGKYGSLKPTGWTGMVGQLLNDVSDVYTPIRSFSVKSRDNRGRKVVVMLFTI